MRTCCADTQPFTLTTGALDVWSDEIGSGLFFHVDAPPEMTTLHWKLIAEITVLATTIYPGEDRGEYSPQLTVVQQIPEDAAGAAVSFVYRQTPGLCFSVVEIALVGRRAGAAWDTITTFPLAPSYRPSGNVLERE